MSEPRATLPQHKAFWASEEPDERIEIIRTMAANVRISVAPEPEEPDATYDQMAASAEIWIAQFIGQRGLIKSATAGSGAKVDNDTWDEAMKIARASMGKFAAEEESEAPSNTAYISSFPIRRA